MNLSSLFALLFRQPQHRDKAVVPLAVLIASLITAIIITSRWSEYREAFKKEGIDHVNFIGLRIDLK